MKYSEVDISQKTILIVDDNEVNRRVLSGMLRRKGFKVSLATNGKEAVELCESERFFAILMDIQMPVMNGFDSSLLIRNIDGFNNIHTPIIAITAANLDGVRSEAQRCGIDRILPKPIRYDHLFEILESLTDHPQEKKALCK